MDDAFLSLNNVSVVICAIVGGQGKVENGSSRTKTKFLTNRVLSEFSLGIHVYIVITENLRMTHTKNLIIGAGPAGLAVAGRLAKLNIPFEVIEKTDTVASTWHNHYERLHLHTAKDLSHLPHLEFPKGDPVYVPRENVVSYMDTYAKHFNINPVFNEEVISIKRENETWITTTASGNKWESENAIIATGFNRVPNIPSWPYMDKYQGILQHSKDYKNGKAFKGKNVLVIGMGNTGAELAIDLYESGANPHISVRGPVNIVSRDLFGKPTQHTALQLQKLPDWLSDLIANTVQKLTIGDLTKYGLAPREMAPSAQLRELGKTPIIDLGTVKLIKQGHVKIHPKVQNFTSTGVVFESGEEKYFDAIVLAVGYKSKVEEFLEDTQSVFNHLGEPKSYRIPEHKGLYFNGFDAYTGGLLYAINLNSKFIVDDILKSAKS